MVNFSSIFLLIFKSGSQLFANYGQIPMVRGLKTDIYRANIALIPRIVPCMLSIVSILFII